MCCYSIKSQTYYILHSFTNFKSLKAQTIVYINFENFFRHNRVDANVSDDSKRKLFRCAMNGARWRHSNIPKQRQKYWVHFTINYIDKCKIMQSPVLCCAGEAVLSFHLQAFACSRKVYVIHWHIPHARTHLHTLCVYILCVRRIRQLIHEQCAHAQPGRHTCMRRTPSLVINNFVFYHVFTASGHDDNIWYFVSHKFYAKQMCKHV